MVPKTKKKTNTPQLVTIQVGCRVAEVDERIADLLQDIWTANIDACQASIDDSDGTVTIYFPEIDDMQLFLNSLHHYNRSNGTMDQPDIDDWVFLSFPNVYDFYFSFE